MADDTQSEQQQPQPESILTPEPPKKQGFGAWLRMNFVAGLLFVLPLVITFYVIRLVVRILDQVLSSLIPAHNLQSYLPYDVFGMEILLGAILLIIIGLIARNIIGRKLLQWGEGIIKAIPGVRSVYSATKQVIETVTMSGSTSFREVVMVEYPRKGVWAIAFVTGTTKGEVQRLTDDEMVNVFLPTTPNPTSGFLLFVAKKDLIHLHMTVDQGIKLIISAGIVTPTLAEGKAALKEARKQDKLAEEAKAPIEASTDEPKS